MAQEKKNFKRQRKKIRLCLHLANLSKGFQEFFLLFCNFCLKLGQNSIIF